MQVLNFLTDYRRVLIKPFSEYQIKKYLHNIYMLDKDKCHLNLLSELTSYDKVKDIEKKDIHVHVPEGAVNKDGPSAGVTMTTTLISLFKNQCVDKSVAMTGEITLRGRVLGIGGLKEKLIGAHRANIRKVFIPKENEKDLDEIPLEIKNDLEFVLVDNYMEIYQNLFQ